MSSSISGISRSTAERVAEVEREDAGLHAATFEPLVQFVETNSLTRVGRDFTGAHPEGFNDLQDAKERWRFDRDGVAGFGDGAQTEVQRFGRAARDDQIVGRQRAAGIQSASRDLLAQ